MARPREFDQEKVITQITALFWQKGFEATSLQDLVQSTGLNKGSLYTCLGNKQKMFELSLDHYLNRGPYAIRRKERAIEALVDYFDRALAEADLPAKDRRGCFIFNSCLEFGNKNSKMTPLILKIAKSRQQVFRKLLAEAQEAGDIPKKVDLDKGAQRVFAAAFTVREMSKFLPDKAFLSEVANAALASLETSARVNI